LTSLHTQPLETAPTRPLIRDPDHGGVDDGLDPHRASDFLT